MVSDPQHAKITERAARVEYAKRKAEIMEREKNNDRLIMFFHSNGRWWKIAGKSVLYYSRILAPRLRRQVNVIPDDDYYGLPSKEGVVNIGDIDELFAEAKKLKYRVKGARHAEFRAIELGKKVTPEELNEMLQEEDRYWELTEKMVQPAVVWPGIKAHLTELTRTGREMTRKLDASLQRVLGDPMMRVIIEMNLVHARAVRKRMEPMEALVAIGDNLEELEAYLAVAGTLKAFKADKAYDFATMILNTEKLVDKELKKQAEKERG